MLASVALRTSIGSRRRSVAVELQQVEGEQEGVGLVPPMAEQVERASPCSSQHTTSPSIRHDRTSRWFTASTTSG